MQNRDWQFTAYAEEHKMEDCWIPYFPLPCSVQDGSGQSALPSPSLLSVITLAFCTIPAKIEWGSAVAGEARRVQEGSQNLWSGRKSKSAVVEKGQENKINLLECAQMWYCWRYQQFFLYKHCRGRWGNGRIIEILLYLYEPTLHMNVFLLYTQTRRSDDDGTVTASVNEVCGIELSAGGIQNHSGCLMRPPML